MPLHSVLLWGGREGNVVGGVGVSTSQPAQEGFCDMGNALHAVISCLQFWIS